MERWLAVHSLVFQCQAHTLSLPLWHLNQGKYLNKMEEEDEINLEAESGRSW